MTATKPPIIFRPLGPQTEPRMRAHDIVCAHTMVGHLTGTDEMFRRGGYSGTESHFGIGGRWGPDGPAGLDGVIYGWQDIDHQADANLDGNPRVISIETADNFPKAASDIAEWTPAQVLSLAALLAWLCSPEAHAGCPVGWSCRAGIPLALVPDSRPGRRGVAYHQQGIDPVRVSGGELWSSARGKECPGPVRIRQLTAQVIPLARALRIDTGDKMTPQELKDLAAAVAAFPIEDQTDDVAGTMRSIGDSIGKAGRYAYQAAAGKGAFAAELREQLLEVSGQLAAVGRRLAAIESTLAAPPPGA